MESNIVVENQCSIEKVDPIFLPVIDSAVGAYRAIFGEAVFNIRLMGSVARGDAGRLSDIDFIAVLHHNPSAEQLAEIARQETELQRRHPFVCQVDLEAVAADELNDFRRFIFAIDSVSLAGSDIYTAERQTVARRQLAEMVTPDLPGIVKSYRRAVEAVDAKNERLLLKWSRLIGKDVLKCFRRISLLRSGGYERNVEAIYRQLLHDAPEHQELLRDLFNLYESPSSHGARLLEALRRAEAVDTSA